MQQGVLSFQNGGSHSGSFTTGANGWIEFGGGYYTGSHGLNAGSTVSGNIRVIAGSGSAPLNINTGAVYNASRTEVVGGGLAITDAGVVAKTGTFSMTGGAFTGQGDLQVSGASSWTGGTIGGYGGNVVTNGGLQITGATGKSLGNYYGAASSGIVNNSAATWSGSGNLSNYNSGRFTNGVKGTFDIQTDADFLNGTLVNQGSLVKSVGVTDGSNKTVVSAVFNNTGTTHVQKGQLEVTTAFTNQGVIDVDSGAVFHGSNRQFTNAGTLTGEGTVQSGALSQKVLQNDGVIDPGHGIGHLSVNGDLVFGDSSSLKIELAGLSSFDQLNVTGDATFAGLLDVWGLGYQPKAGDSFIVMTFDGARLDGSTFAGVNGHGLASGLTFDVVYNEHDVTLNVMAVPEPGELVLTLAGLVVLGVSAKRRQRA